MHPRLQWPAWLQRKHGSLCFFRCMSSCLAFGGAVSIFSSPGVGSFSVGWAFAGLLLRASRSRSFFSPCCPSGGLNFRSLDDRCWARSSIYVAATGAKLLELDSITSASSNDVCTTGANLTCRCCFGGIYAEAGKAESEIGGGGLYAFSWALRNSSFLPNLCNSRKFSKSFLSMRSR